MEMPLRTLLTIFILIAPSHLTGQEKIPEDWGLTSIPYSYAGQKVDIILLSAGTEFKSVKKPLFLFIQGSLPKPLLISNRKGDTFSVFPFNPMPYYEDFHFVMVGKPGVPLQGIMEDLAQPYLLSTDPKTGLYPEKYCENNHLDYYVSRNRSIIDFLAKKEWVDESQIVVAGHSEGVSVALKMAIDKVSMTHLILLNAGMEGRLMALVSNHRKREVTESDHQKTEDLFSYWQKLVSTAAEDWSDECSNGDSDKTTGSFSFPYRNHLQEIDMPVFVGYDTKDESVLLMDNFRVEAIRLQKENFYFKSYFGWEHNFFGFKDDGTVNFDDYNYDTVAKDFFEWLSE